MKRFLFILSMFSLSLIILNTGCTGTTTEKEKEYSQAILKKNPVASVYEIEYTSIDGQRKSIGDYKNKVIMFVNTASKCGYTSQYAELEKIYKRYKDRGFVIIGFPCNQFFGQEPSGNSEILNFCQVNYGVTFPLSEKIDVHGPKKHLLYAYLTGQKAAFPGKISWNFQKFLVSRKGKVIARFDPGDAPQSKQIIKTIEEALAEK